MTDKERMAIAMLRSGSSWRDATKATGIAFDELKKLWQKSEEEKRK